MSNVGSIGSRRTDDLLDVVAHDAGVVDKDHHVKATAGTKSQAQIWKERHGDEGPLDAAKHAGKAIVEHLLPDFADEGLHAGAGAGGLVIGGILKFYAEGLHELDRAEKKADELRAAGDNDAVNVALAKGLAFDPRFGEAEKAQRPGVEKATGKILETLNGKDAEIKAVLQQRADEGFLAAKRAFEATKGLPPAQRAAEMQKQIGTRMREDAAFGKGAEYFIWAASTPGVDLASETKKVQDRQAPERGVHVRG